MVRGYTAVLAALLVVAGCGGDGDGARKSPTPRAGAPASGSQKGGPTLSLAARSGAKAVRFRKSIAVGPNADVAVVAVSRSAPKGAKVRVLLPASGGPVLDLFAELVDGRDIVARAKATLRVKGGSDSRVGDLRVFSPTFESVVGRRRGSRYVLEAPAAEQPNRSLTVYLKVAPSV